MTLRLTSVLGNSQKLDGGSMFGNAPRAVWERWSPPDERHRIDLACRALLVEEEGGRRILFETGIGAFFAPELRDRYGVQEDRHVLLENLAALGLSDADIDVVVLSHLHFDHAGGLLAAHEVGSSPRLLFPRARFIVGRSAFERNKSPHPRDKASYIAALPALLDESGRLELVVGPMSEALGPGYHFHLSDGHTPGLLLSEIATGQGPVLFAADLIPGTPWLRQSITMGYDRYPELLIDEKTELLDGLVEQRGMVFFTHDPKVALSRVERDPKGVFQAADARGALVREVF